MVTNKEPFRWKEELFKLQLNLLEKNQIAKYIEEKQTKIKSLAGLKKAIKEYHNQK